MVFESDIQKGSISPMREAYVAERIGKLLREREQPDLPAEFRAMNEKEMPELESELAMLHHYLHGRKRTAA
jgi:hypothetical protein